MILEAENVLSPEVLRKMYNISMKIKGISHEKRTWQDFCFKMPIISKPRCFDERYVDMLLKHKNLDALESERTNKGCDKFEMPKMSILQGIALLPYLKRMKTEGLTSSISKYKS